MIFALAEQLDSLHTAACERLPDAEILPPLRYGIALRLAGGLFRVDQWLALPWRCRLAGHDPERRVHYNLDACAVEEGVVFPDAGRPRMIVSVAMHPCRKLGKRVARAIVGADPTRRARVNRDDLRGMLHDGVYLGHETEGQVVAVEDWTSS